MRPRLEVPSPPAVRPWLLVLAAVSVGLLVAALLLIRQPSQEPPAPARPDAAPGVPAPPAAWAPAADGPRPEATAAAAAAARGAVQAALTRRFRGLAVPRPVIRLLAAGDVAAALAAIPPTAPHAAAIGWELLALCRDRRALAGPDAEAQAVPGTPPEAESGLRAMQEAGRGLEARLGAGCEAAKLEPLAVRERIRAAAAAGDAASLERLAAAEPAAASRLESAALLGAAGAQYRLALDLLAMGPDDGQREDRRRAGLSWLKEASRHDPDAEAAYATCELTGCAGHADPAAGRALLESAARHGSLYALGLLAAPAESRVPWVAPGDAVAPLPLADPALLADDPARRYAWSVLAARLAAAGCFGFAWGPAALALAGPGRLAPALSPAAQGDAERAAERLVDEALPAAEAAYGCEGD